MSVARKHSSAAKQPTGPGAGSARFPVDWKAYRRMRVRQSPVTWRTKIHACITKNERQRMNLEAWNEGTWSRVATTTPEATDEGPSASRKPYLK